MQNSVRLFLAFTVLAVIGGIALISGGCQSSPVDKEVFIGPEYVPLMKKHDNLPFNKAWGKPGEIRKFDKVYIADITTQHQLERNQWEKMNVRSDQEKNDFQEFAQYTRNAFINAFKNSGQFKVADKPGPKTLTIELALVKIVPGKPIVGAISNITNLTPFGLLLIPFKVGGKMADSPMNASVVIEGVLRDSTSGDIVGVFADSRRQTAALFNTKDFSAYGNLRQIVDNWALETVEVLDQVRRGEKADVQDRNEAFLLFN